MSTRSATGPGPHPGSDAGSGTSPCASSPGRPFPCMMPPGWRDMAASPSFENARAAFERLNRARGAPVLPVLALRAAPLRCLPGATWFQAWLETGQGPAQANAVAWDGEFHALEDDHDVFYAGADLDSPDAGDRAARCLELARMLCPLGGMGAQPFYPWLSVDELSRHHAPAPDLEGVPDAEPAVSWREDGGYVLRCLLSHGGGLFRVALAAAPGAPMHMETAELLASVPPVACARGAHGWLYLTGSAERTYRST